MFEKKLFKTSETSLSLERISLFSAKIIFFHLLYFYWKALIGLKVLEKFLLYQ